MNTPDIDALEARCTEAISILSGLLAGKTSSQKQMIIAKLFGGTIFSTEHEGLGYWTVSTRFGSGIFSLERDTFLELPGGKGMGKYFSNITSKGAIPLSDESVVLTLSFGGERVSARDLMGIERFCYIENGQIHTFDELPRSCSLQMAITLFQTKRNVMIARESHGKGKLH